MPCARRNLYKTCLIYKPKIVGLRFRGVENTAQASIFLIDEQKISERLKTRWPSYAGNLKVVDHRKLSSSREKKHF